MTIILRFASSAQATGLTASAFERSSAGVGLFFNFRESANIAGDNTARFPSISAPGEYAFRLDSPAGAKFRSGPQLMQTTPTTDTFMVLDAGTTVFSPAALSGMLPKPPIVSGPMTMTSISLAVGNGSINATGAATYASSFGPVSVTFSYEFTFDPVLDPADMRFPGGIPPSVSVRTIGLTLTGATGGPVGWLVNSIMGLLFGVFHDRIRSSIESTVQDSVDAAVARALAARSAPTGTVATVESLSIDPTVGLTLRAWAGFSQEKACGLTPSGGPSNLRPAEQLTHLRAIRERVLRRSPQGVAYIELFEHFSPELVRILRDDEDLLGFVDGIVARVLEEFPREHPGDGRLSADAAEDVARAMDQIRRLASPELGLTLAALREEVVGFVDRPAAEVLEESLRLIEA